MPESVGAIPALASAFPGPPVLAELETAGAEEFALEIRERLDVGAADQEPVGTLRRRGDHRKALGAVHHGCQQRLGLGTGELHLAGDQELDRLRRGLKDHDLRREAFVLEEALLDCNVDVPIDRVAGHVADDELLRRAQVLSG